MNNNTNRLLALLALGLLASPAHAEYWAVDEQVKNFNQISAQIMRGDLQAAESGLDSIRQNIDKNDVRIGQYQRELATAYLQLGRQQLATGNNEAAAATLGRGEQHLVASSAALKEQYQASLAAATAQSRQAAAEAEAKATLAREEAERARQQRLAAEKAAAERQARAQQQAQAAAAAAPAPAVAKPVAAAPRARLIDPQATSSSVPMPMLDVDDRDSLRNLLDQVAADVVAFDCAVRLEVREAKDYPFVAALLSARIKKLDPGFAPQFSPVLKPDQEPRLVLSPQSNG